MCLEASSCTVRSPGAARAWLEAIGTRWTSSEKLLRLRMLRACASPCHPNLARPCLQFFHLSKTPWKKRSPIVMRCVVPWKNMRIRSSSEIESLQNQPWKEKTHSCQRMEAWNCQIRAVTGSPLTRASAVDVGGQLKVWFPTTSSGRFLGFGPRFDQMPRSAHGHFAHSNHQPQPLSTRDDVASPKKDGRFQKDLLYGSCTNIPFLGFYRGDLYHSLGSLRTNGAKRMAFDFNRPQYLQILQ